MEQGQRWLAHISEDGREQTVLEHLTGTAELCAGFSAPFCDPKIGLFTGLLHDIGKYSPGFQRRIQGSPIRVDHTTAGAFECAKRGCDPIAYCISGHHGGLPDGGGRGDLGKSTLLSRIRKAQSGQLEPYDAWLREVSLPQIEFPQWLNRDPLTDSFFIRMLYSCLVDADFLDTERFMAGREPPRGGGDSMETLRGRLDRYTSGWFPPKGELNRRRCEILTRCNEQGAAQSPGLFSLTVPTGGGKTVASLAFALNHAAAHGLRRIIYVIPYTSIIEQTAAVFRRILGRQNVLEHHCDVLYDTGEDGELTPENARLIRATENWDMPVIVTTAVQFFESLYANKPSKCRKLHHLADSVVIFDEAQMLPLDYLRPCVSAISQLVAHYHVSAVLCTATQPALEPVFREFLPEGSLRELCPPEYYDDPVFRRVCFHDAGAMDWDALAEAMNAKPQVLCIVNSRKGAQALYERLEGTGVFHLSTLMTPVHRKEVLAAIRRRLVEGLPCKVVSTSLIEAGVDVDFPAVFREAAGLDSILQAAGRCNREGKRPPEESIVTVFTSPQRVPPLFETAVGAGKRAMRQFPDIASREAITFYFREWRNFKGPQAQDAHDILRQLQTARFPFATVAGQFRLIDSNTCTVYIPLGQGAELLARYRAGERTKGLFRALGQYSVSIFEHHLNALYAAGDVMPLENGGYELVNPGLYSGETGLSLEADGGKALFI